MLLSVKMKEKNGRILSAIESQMIKPVMSQEIQVELCRILDQKIQKALEITPEKTQEVTEDINSQIIQTDISVMGTEEDESDNRYIELALASRHDIKC